MGVCFGLLHLLAIAVSLRDPAADAGQAGPVGPVVVVLVGVLDLGGVVVVGVGGHVAGLNDLLYGVDIIWAF